MKLNAFRLVALALPILNYVPSANSQSSQFADCELAKKEIDQTKEFLPDPARISLLTKLVADVAKITTETTSTQSPYPPSMLRTCLDLKRQAIEEAIRLAPDSIRARAEFLKILGHYSLLVGRNEVAYRSFVEASNKDPSDFSARLKGFDAFIKFKLSQFRQLTKDGGAKGPLPLTRGDIDGVLNEADKILTPVVQGTRVPVEVRIEALSQRADLIEKVGGDYSRAVKDWKLIVDLDPKNRKALGNIVAYEKSRGLTTELKKYLALLLKIDQKNPVAWRDYLEIVYKDQDWSLLMKEAGLAIEKIPLSSELLAFYAKGLLENQQDEKAKTYSKKALKIDSKNILARKIQKEILIKEANLLIKEGKTTLALNKLQKARTLDQKDFDLAKQIAFTIFDFYRDSSSSSTQNLARKKDMKAVSNLLTPSLEEPNLDQTALTILIESSFETRNAKTGFKACQTIEKNFGTLQNADLILKCCRMYVQNGQTDLAKARLQTALNQESLTGNKSALSEYLLKILPAN